MGKPKVADKKPQIPGTGRAAESARTAGVKVRALRLGYYDHKRRREGDVFVIRGAKFENDVMGTDANDKPVVLRKKGDLIDFASWMEYAEPQAAEHTTTSQEALQKRSGEIKDEKSGDRVGDDEGAGEGSESVI